MFSLDNRLHGGPEGLIYVAPYLAIYAADVRSVPNTQSSRHNSEAGSVRTSRLDGSKQLRDSVLLPIAQAAPMSRQAARFRRHGYRPDSEQVLEPPRR